MARSFSSRRHFGELLDIEPAAAGIGVGSTVVATRAHLEQNALPVGARLGDEAELLHRICGKHVADVDQGVSRGRSGDHIAIRLDRCGALGFVGDVSERVRDGDRPALNR